MRHLLSDYLKMQSGTDVQMDHYEEQPTTSGSGSGTQIWSQVDGINQVSDDLGLHNTLPLPTPPSFQASGTPVVMSMSNQADAPLDGSCPRVQCQIRNTNTRRLYAQLQSLYRIITKSQTDLAEMKQAVLEEKLTREKLTAEWNANMATSQAKENVEVIRKLEEKFQKLEAEMQQLRNDHEIEKVEREIETRNRMSETKTEDKEFKDWAREFAKDFENQRKLWETRQTEIFKVFNRRQQCLEEKMGFYCEAVGDQDNAMKRFQTKMRQLQKAITEEIDERTEDVDNLMESLQKMENRLELWIGRNSTLAVTAQSADNVFQKLDQEIIVWQQKLEVIMKKTEEENPGTCNLLNLNKKLKRRQDLNGYIPRKKCNVLERSGKSLQDLLLELEGKSKPTSVIGPSNANKNGGESTEEKNPESSAFGSLNMFSVQV